MSKVRGKDGKLKLRYNPHWIRQPGETATQFHHFQRYLAMNRWQRSSRQVAHEYWKARFPKMEEPATPTRIHNMGLICANNRWVARVEAYDAAEDEDDARLLLMEKKKARQKRLELARLQIEKAESKLTKVDIDAMTVEEMRKLLHQGVTAERLELGEVDVTRTELTGRDGEELPSAAAVVKFYIPSNGRDDDSTTPEEAEAKPDED